MDDRELLTAELRTFFAPRIMSGWGLFENWKNHLSIEAKSDYHSKPVM